MSLTVIFTGTRAATAKEGGLIGQTYLSILDHLNQTQGVIMAVTQQNNENLNKTETVQIAGRPALAENINRSERVVITNS